MLSTAEQCLQPRPLSVFTLGLNSRGLISVFFWFVLLVTKVGNCCLIQDPRRLYSRSLLLLEFSIGSISVYDMKSASNLILLNAELSIEKTSPSPLRKLRALLKDQLTMPGFSPSAQVCPSDCTVLVIVTLRKF